MKHPNEFSMEIESPLVFISYTTKDRDRIVAYYDYLNRIGCNVWMDIKQLKAGQNWRFEIEKALDRASIVLTFLSNNSVDKRGVVQRELRDALDKSKEKLQDDIYIIPVLLDDEIVVPAEISRLHYIRESEGDCEGKIRESIDLQLEKLDRGIAKAQEESSLRWSKVVKKEEWPGLPGYELRCEYLQFSSEEYLNVSEIDAIVRGEITKLVSRHRSAMLEQEPDLRNFGQDKFWRTNTMDIAFDQPSTVGRVLSLQCGVYQMNGGAAHPFAYTKTFSFLLFPLVYIQLLQDLFVDSERAFAIVQKLVRQRLLGPRGEDQGDLDQDWVERGTDSWDDFSSFVFKRDGIDLLFAPYHVGCYADGPQSCTISFLEIFDEIKPVFKSALGIEYITTAAAPLTVHQQG